MDIVSTDHRCSCGDNCSGGNNAFHRYYRAGCRAGKGAAAKYGMHGCRKSCAYRRPGPASRSSNAYNSKARRCEASYTPGRAACHARLQGSAVGICSLQI